MGKKSRRREAKAPAAAPAAPAVAPPAAWQTVADETGDMMATAVSGSRSIENPHAYMQGKKIRVAKFWARHGKQFTEYWKGLAVQEREGLVRTVSPFTPVDRHTRHVKVGGEYHDVHGVMALCPELNLKDLAGGDGQGLIRLFEQRGKAYEAPVATSDYVECIVDDMDMEDLQHVQPLIKEGRLQRRKPNSFVMLHGEEGGQEWDITSKAPRDPAAMATIRSMLWSHVWPSDSMYYVRRRQETILDVLLLTGDTYKEEVLDKADSTYCQAARNLGCGTCGLHERADVHLLLCAKCKARAYCSVECQAQDWPAHKARCHSAKQDLVDSLTGVSPGAGAATDAASAPGGTTPPPPPPPATPLMHEATPSERDDGGTTGEMQHEMNQLNITE